MKEEQDFKEKEINKTNEENSDLKEQKIEDSETSKINEEKINPEDKLIELEDKFALQKWKNQRRRYEKEKRRCF